MARSECPTEQRRDQRRQRGQVGGQVDVHVREHRRRPKWTRPRAAPGRGPSRPGAPPAPRAARRPAARRPPGVPSVLALSATVIRNRYGKPRGQVRVQPADGGRQIRLLVVHRNHHVQRRHPVRVRRRPGRRRPGLPGGLLEAGRQGRRHVPRLGAAAGRTPVTALCVRCGLGDSRAPGQRPVRKETASPSARSVRTGSCRAPTSRMNACSPPAYTCSSRSSRPAA